MKKGAGSKGLYEPVSVRTGFDWRKLAARSGVLLVLQRYHAHLVPSIGF